MNTDGFSLPGFDVVPASANGGGLQQEINRVAPQPPPTLAFPPAAQAPPDAHVKTETAPQMAHPLAEFNAGQTQGPEPSVQPAVPKHETVIFVDGGETPMVLDTSSSNERDRKPTFKVDSDGILSHDPVLDRDREYPSLPDPSFACFSTNAWLLTI